MRPIAPCRFKPTIGVEFTGNVTAWWLLSASCASAALVGENDDWTRVETLNIDFAIIAKIQGMVR